jgi:radical SAM superfamily enzyme YgiQ (UPF0313 family)
MKIVLVSIHPYPSPQSIPLAGAFLKSYLDEYSDPSAGFCVELIELFADHPTDEATSLILEKKPDLVGFSVYLWNRKKTIEIVPLLRRERPNLIITGGGPEATADPEGLLRESLFDFLIIGEGEVSFYNAIKTLLAGKSVTGSEGTAALQHGKLFIAKGCPIENLDTIPSPYLTGAIGLPGQSGVLWQLSRGCAFQCDYCFDSLGIPGVRYFSIKRIRDELLLFSGKEVSQVFVIDSTFNLDKKRAKEILRLIATLAPHVHFHFEVRYDLIDAEMARLFAGINCSLQIGLQSSDPKVNMLVNRRFAPDRFSTKIGMLNQTGVVFGFDLIYGLPGDSLKGFLSSIDYALGLYPNHLDIFPLSVLPGSNLSFKAEILGLHHLASPPYTVSDSPGFPFDDMEKAAGVALSCDIFYSRGKAVAWFNSILRPLGTAPSSFLSQFREWLKVSHGNIVNEHDLSDQVINRLQHDFIILLYKTNGLSGLLPAAMDMIDYHWLYAEAVMSLPVEGLLSNDSETMSLLEIPFRVSQSVKLWRFNYDICDILDAGEVDLENFVACCTPSGSFAIIYPKSGEVRCEALIDKYFSLLTRLDGTHPPHILATDLNISPHETVTFLQLCLEEGIIESP